MNVVVLRGAVSRPPEIRELRSGQEVLSYNVTVPGREGGPAESVPVVWFDPPAGAGDLAPASEVVVLGRVRRRFFRANGVTQSRTEVVADRVIPARRAKVAARAARQTLAAAEEAFI
ncbi:MAG TPA: single-stranded DNA-binding protein [Acidimicrobiales bacterium]|nr:single-stranded DNA-binding protein [Acidimicrobiales bacterium]